MNREELYDILNSIAPPEYAESWDNCGRQVELADSEINRILLAMEINHAVIDEAAALGAELIITHHPLVVDPIKNFTHDEVPGAYVLRLAREGISLFSMHTNFDCADGGINDYIAELIGLTNIMKSARIVPEMDEALLLRTGDLEEPVTLSDFARELRNLLPNGPGLRVAGEPDKMIYRVSVCGGGGSGYWTEALYAGADLFISGDIKHHDAAGALASGLAVIDATHAATEVQFGENLAEKLMAYELPLEIFVSEVDINPFTFQIS